MLCPMPGDPSHFPTPDTPPQPRWSAALTALAPFTALFLPTLTARRFDHVPLALAWIAHAVGVVMVLLLIAILGAWSDTEYPATPMGVLGEAYVNLEWFINSVGNDRDALKLLVVGVIATGFFIEAGTLGLAWVMSAWAARPEPFGRSLRRSVTRTWLITSHACIYIVLWACPMTWMDRLYWEYLSKNNYNYYDLPWLLDLREEIYALLFLFVSLLGVVVLIRALSGGVWRACGRWPAQCEGCGYSLMSQPNHASCPECGRAVAASTSQSTRNRPLTRGGPGLIGDWCWANAMAVVRPKLLGQRLHTLTPSRHRAMMFLPTVLGLLFIAAAGALGMTIVVWMADVWRHMSLSQIVSATTISCIVSLLLGTLITFAAASVVGASARFAVGRNLLPLAMDGSVAMGGFLMVCNALFWCVLICFFFVMEVLDMDRALRQAGIQYQLITIGLVFGGPLIMAVVYLVILGRITFSGRYANT